MPRPNAGLRPRLRFAIVATGVFIISFLAFRPVLDAEFLNWDDPQTLILNEAYRGLSAGHLRWMFTTGHMGHYQPLAWVTFAIDWLVWGMRPAGFHLTSLLLHALSAVLVMALAMTLLRMAGSGESQRDPRTLPGHFGAAIAALVFSIHPMRVESVAWLTERRDVLCGVFLLLTVLAYVRFAAAAHGSAARRGWYALALAAFTAAALSKALAVALPFILLVLDWHPLGRFRPRGRSRARASAALVIEKAPFLLIALAAGIVILSVQSGLGLIAPLERHPLSARIAQAVYGLAYYPWRTFWPIQLRPLYEMPDRVDPREWPIVLSAAALLVIGAIVIAYHRRLRGFIAATMAYVLFVFPVLGLLQTGTQFVADRYSYLSCIGFALLAGAAAQRGLDDRRAAVRGGTAACALIVLAVLVTMTTRYAAVWRSSRALWGYATQMSGDSPTAWNNYGSALLADGEPRDAITAFQRALALRPWHANACFNLARAHAQLGDFAASVAASRAGLAIMPGNLSGRLLLADSLAAQGDRDGAARELETLLREAPDHQAARDRLEQLRALHENPQP
jgi:cytochrome c-type biogenesis protein CcmH/NrfG